MIENSIFVTKSRAHKTHLDLIYVSIFGLLLPLSFAPFHLPGAAILSLALFYTLLAKRPRHTSFLNGLFFGLAYFGLGTSWVFVSIHEYGHLNYIVSALITLIFILYLALFPAIMAFSFKNLQHYSKCSPFSVFSCLLFASFWVIFEYFRTSFLSGFPWLLLGLGQIDAPAKYLLPIIGVLGVSFFTCFTAALLAKSAQLTDNKRHVSLICFVILLLLPSLLKHKPLLEERFMAKSLSVGVIQANLSMRDKWDSTLFWNLLKHYSKSIKQLLGTDLIVMPESSIPIPASYVSDFLSDLHLKAKAQGSAIMLGIPTIANTSESAYFNGLISLGKARGKYLKQHLVPFGEYIPVFLHDFSHFLGIPMANLKPGNNHQTLIKIHDHPVATLICYELAYEELLRAQLPVAEWIVSVSDDGWFGHSLAQYQQLQIAQVRSKETKRYQVVANNDGLSSIINDDGEIVAILPAFTAGILQAKLQPITDTTFWVRYGNLPILLFAAIIILLSIQPLMFNIVKNRFR